MGSKTQVNEFTQTILERVFGEPYQEQFSIKIESECPKQITCRGGVRIENLRTDAHPTPETVATIELMRPRNINAMKYCYSMTDVEQFTMDKVNDLAVRDQLVARVKELNQFFIDLCDNVTRDEFGIDNKVMNLFKQVLNNNVDNYLVAGINAFLQGRYDDDVPIEDVPFFYPIIGIIRYNLLSNLCNEVISKL